MGIFQIPLLHCLILSIIVGISAETDLLLKNPKNTTEECYCVPITDSEKRVSEILKSELQQDERLVVYLYKNSHNEVTIYIPNSEKQKVLPEFTLDDDDLLKRNATANTNNLFYLDKSDGMIHESSSGLDVNSNHLLDVRPNSITLSNLPYLITGYIQFLQKPLNFLNLPKCCDITLPGPIHHHLNKDLSCCVNTVMLLQSLFGIHSHLPIDTKEIARNKLELNENKVLSNVDTEHPQNVSDHIILQPSKENIPLSPDGLHHVLDLIISQLNKEKPSNSDNVLLHDVFDFIIPQSNKEKPSNSDEVHPQDVLDLIIPQPNKEKPSNSDEVHLQDVLDIITPQPNKEKPSNSDQVHTQDVLDLIIPQPNKEKPSNSDEVHPQDVLDSIIPQPNKEKPSNSDEVHPQDVLDSIIPQLNKEKPSNSDEVHPQDSIIPQPNKEKPSNSDEVHPQDSIILQPNKEKPSNSNEVHPQDVLDLIIPQPNKEKPSNSDNDHPQDVLDLIIPGSNEVKPSNSDNVHAKDVLDYIIPEPSRENITLHPDGIQDELNLIIPQQNKEKPSNSDKIHPQNVLDYMIPVSSEKSIPLKQDDVLDKWNLIISQSNKEKPSNSDNVYPKDELHHIILETNNNKKPADLYNVYPQYILDSMKEIKPLNPSKNYQVHVNSDYIDMQDLKDQQNYEILVTQDLEDNQKYTNSDRDQNPFLIIYGPKQSKNHEKYNDETLMFLNKYISSLKEKHSYLNPNKTPGPSQINDHYNIISESNRHQINYLPSSKAFGQITFDQWLSLQVKLFKKYKYAMSYAIDIKMLKYMLQKTLYKNGISVTNAGDLIDFNGERLNIDSLELRPVLIGDPLKYEEFLSSHNCVIRSKFPYVEAILVTLSKPHRFLGLISLSEASFSDTRRSGSLICPPTSNENKFSSVPIKSESLLKYSNDLWNRRNSPNDLPDYQDKLWGSKKNNVKPNDKEFSDSEDISPPIELGSEEYDYSDIGLRIIGGQAATSSGTPVSSKGRRSVNDLNEIR